MTNLSTKTSDNDSPEREEPSVLKFVKPDTPDERFLREFMQPLIDEYHRTEQRYEQEGHFAPGRYWTVACGTESLSTVEENHLDICQRCRDKYIQALKAIHADGHF